MPNYNIPAGERYPLGVDCAGRPYGEAVAQSPYSLICRYLSDGGASLPGKQLHPDEAADYIGHDVALVSNWETYETRMSEGHDAGYQDARTAWNVHKACGGPDGATVYFSCDYDSPESDQVGINAYLQGAVDYLGIDSVGIYAGFHVARRARAAFPGLKVWQTAAWSGGNVLNDIQLYQRIGFAWVGGSQCDVNEIRTPGRVGAWQDQLPTSAKDYEMGTITSLVDGKVMTPEETLGYVDLHAYQSAEQGKAIVEALNEQNALLTQILTKFQERA